VEQPGVETSGQWSAPEAPGGEHRAAVPTASGGALPESVDLISERDELRARVQRLEAELERYRAQAEVTNKLLVSATNYAEWVRERARRDADLALRKASGRVEKLARATRALEQTQNEVVRLQDELDRLRTLTDATRTRLSAFLTAGLQALNAEAGPGRAPQPVPTPDHLDDALRRQLPSTLFTHDTQLPSNNASGPPLREDVDPPESR
jgi:DivIVA protein